MMHFCFSRVGSVNYFGIASKVQIKLLAEVANKRHCQCFQQIPVLINLKVANVICSVLKKMFHMLAGCRRHL